MGDFFLHVGALVLGMAFGLFIGSAIYKAIHIEVKAATPPTDCCLETRDDRFIRVVGSQCNEWRLAIPGCE